MLNKYLLKTFLKGHFREVFYIKVVDDHKAKDAEHNFSMT